MPGADAIIQKVNKTEEGPKNAKVPETAKSIFDCKTRITMAEASDEKKIEQLMLFNSLTMSKVPFIPGPDNEGLQHDPLSFRASFWTHFRVLALEHPFHDCSPLLFVLSTSLLI
ncbi:MAG TPA: hypothetical protein V6C97_15835 [Oculatellaceae cyanobacterium]